MKSKTRAAINDLICAAKNLRSQYEGVMRTSGHSLENNPYLKQFNTAVEAYEKLTSGFSVDAYVKENLIAIKAALLKLRKKFKTCRSFGGVGVGVIDDGGKITKEKFTLFVYWKTKPSPETQRSCVEMDGFNVTICGPWSPSVKIRQKWVGANT